MPGRYPQHTADDATPPADMTATLATVGSTAGVVAVLRFHGHEQVAAPSLTAAGAVAVPLTVKPMLTDAPAASAGW
jgi:hypothetical protein